MDTLISVVKAQVAAENEVRYGGHDTLKVYSRCEQPYAPAIYFDLENDFCILNNVLTQPNSLAAYLFVRLDDAEQMLSCKLKRSDQVRDFEEWEELLSLEVSIPDDEIASKLIDYVVTATKLQ